MSLSILSVLLFLALLAYALRRRRWSFAFFSLFLCGMFLFGTGFLPSLLLSRLQTHSRLEFADWQKRTAILLLGSGGVRRSMGGKITSSMFGFSRVFEAARLYHDCQERGGFCVVVPCGGDPLKLGITEAEMMKRELMSVGVPEASILTESKSSNTYQNALFARELLAGQAFEQLVLVTSGVHMERALKFFRHFEMDVLPSSSDELQASPSVLPKGMNFFVTDAAMHEVLGILRFHVYNLLGWNAKST